MNKYILILLTIIIIGTLSYFVITSNETLKLQTSTNPLPIKNQILEQNDRTNTIQPDLTLINSPGLYQTYSPQKILLAETKQVVLFFHAPWCPTCRALNSDIEKNANLIPSNLIILKTDYDGETELKQKYGVTTQHTLVQIDGSGTLIKKWSGGSSLNSILDKLK